MIQFNDPNQVLYVCAGLGALVFGALLWWNIFRTDAPLSRRGVIFLGVAWIAVGTFEYWIFGTHSALGRPDEYNVSIPWIYYQTHFHDGGLYAHGFAGGVDAKAGAAFGGEYLSLERLFFGALPLWLALSVMNIGAIGLGYAGGYRLARSALKLTRGKAMVVGLIASGTHLANLAWAAGGIGWAIALMPWGVYLLGLRTARRWYFPTVLGFALIYSGSTSIIHSLPAFFVGLLACCLFFRPAHPGRFLFGCILLGVVAVLNWSDVIYALMQTGSESARTNVINTPPGLLEHLRLNADVLVLPAGLVALVVFVFRRDRLGLLAVAAFWLVFASGHILGALNWRATGLNLVAAYRWDLVSDGCFVVGLVVVGRVLALQDWSASRWIGPVRLPPFAGIYFAGLAVLALAHHKAINLVNYRYYGGAALFTEAPLLASPAWRDREPFRVVTEYGLFAPGTTNAYGLDTFDGSVQAFSMRRNKYYGWALLQPRNPAPHTHVHFLILPAAATEVGSHWDLAGLRVANVRYVLSARRLTDPGLKLVAGQDAPAPAASGRRHWAPKESVGAVYVYENAGAWPRAFVPARVSPSVASIQDEAFYRELLADTTVPAMLVARDDAPRLAGPLPSPAAVRLEKFQLVRNGFDLTVAPVQPAAPARGVVVINAPYSSFWQATAGGQPRVIVPVNGIHLAVILEPGDRAVTVRYTRQSLADRIADWLGVSVGR